MDAEAHALPDAHLLRRDIFHPAHQAKAFVAIDPRHIERLPVRGMHDGCGVDGPQSLADAPFQTIAAGERAKHAGIKHGSSSGRAELVGQVTACEVIDVRLEWSVLIAGHACRWS